jgi:hypothetical protein
MACGLPAGSGLRAPEESSTTSDRLVTVIAPLDANSN